MFQCLVLCVVFVNKHKPELARRIEKGLTLAIENGTFSNLFNQYYAETLEKIDFKHRRIIKLENPYLSKETQLITNRSELWIDTIK